MKLELKHLAPYLPYSLRWFYKKNIYNTAYLSTKKCALINITGFGEIDKFTWSAIQGKHKPILRPLSDLTKPFDNDNRNVSYAADLGYYSKESVDKLISNPLTHNYFTFIKLLENYFDVFGLIEKGLAVDINTLK